MDSTLQKNHVRRAAITLLVLLCYLTGARAQQALPYSYGFEDNALTTDGWVLQGATSISTGINSTAKRTGTYGFHFHFSEQNAYLLSPVLTGGDVGIDLSFWYKEASSNYGDEQFQVGYTDDETNEDASTYNYGGVVTASTSWQEYTNSFPAGTKRIAIKYIYNDCFYLYLDDFTFEVHASCVKPTGVTVSDITNEGAVVSWTSDADAWNVRYRISGSTDDWTIESCNKGTEYPLDGLDAGTTYEVQVQTDCGSGSTSNWTDIVSFTTAFCDPVNQCLVNITLTDSYGDGWNNNQMQVVDAETGAILGTFTLSSGNSGSFTLNVCKDRTINFVYVASGNYSTENGWVITDVNDDVIAEREGCNNGCDPTPGIVATYTVDCDNSCQKPKNLTTSELTATSVKLTWEGTADEWIIGYVADDPTEEYELVPGVTENTYTITGLAPETLYYVAVRPACDMKWCDQVSFTTLEKYPAPTAIAVSDITTNSAAISWTGTADSYNLRYRTITENVAFFEDFEGLTGNALPDGWTTIDADGDGQDWFSFTPDDVDDKYGNPTVFDTSCATSASFNSNTQSALNPDNWLVSPQLDLQGNLSVWVRAQDPDWAAEHFAIYLSTTGTDVADFTTTLVAETEATDEYVEYTADLSAYEGQQGYIAIRHFNCTDMFRLNVDNFTITSITPTSEWVTVNNATSPKTLESLAEYTKYQVQVQGVYSEGTSKWAGTIFTTLSSNPVATDVVVTPAHTSATISWTANSDSYEVKYRTAAYSEKIFFEDFESGIGEWTTSNLESGGGVMDGAGISGGAGFAFKWTSNPPQYLISPELSGIVEGNKLSFSYKNYSAGYQESFKVGYSTKGNDVENDFTWSEETTVDADTNWHLYELTLPADVTYVSIQCTSDDMYYLFVDNIGIYGADIPAGEWTTVPTTETSVEITGLEMDTEYEYQIIGIKNSTPNEGTAIASFTTYSENDKLFLADGNWNVDANWTPAGVPTATQNALLYAAVTIPSGVVATAKNVTIDGGSITIKDGGELKTNSTVDVTMEKSIAGYGDGEGKFNLISSIVDTEYDSDAVEGLMEGDYDYFRFVRSMNLEWRSYALTNFNMTAGNGFLYANKANKTLKFTGETWASQDNTLTMSVTYSDSYPMSMILAGNPFTCTGTIYFVNGSNNITGTIYKLNAAGDGFEAYEGYASVAPGEAVLVEYSESGKIYFESENYGNGTSLGAAEILLPQHGSTANVDAGPVITLTDDATDNSDAITTYNGKNIVVRLADRTLYKDGKWNTLTVPFGVTIAGSALDGATAREVSDATVSGSTLNLTFSDPVDALVAGTPYIIKWADGDNIVAPVFTNVVIDNTDNSYDNGEAGNEQVRFLGTYDALTFESEDESILFMGANNNLYYPNGEAPSYVKACRAYFKIGDESGANVISYFNIDFGDETTSVNLNVNDNLNFDKNAPMYNISGQRVSDSYKGIVIVNGKKVVIK